ncbi:MAG TPA: hypothetical protein DEQ87_10155 [Algoriphagus sp.]|jgi:hypothetical protein|uniref:hypothetical protein n=1 Tax=unclassified Algoriphagus TaxID=2641541 RepID=UPI000C4B3908|nr:MULTISPECIES: hypothetical protein [unclassified Algoriphagus]MAL12267.1 hypothetical protein [Algoriphagus sp.]QYH40116.1 hypothetical protein GYM62_15455 [Algoriphagus sp. NBT04N3]HAH39091.1 hypothetical protein [Algoriphagus sp.]HAS58839.1 hypothetical protein [Algoriphagus sp.]HAZ25708.1 hypothetical protein [Algoriphagus sp.]|tara:strand:+ start:1041 stop:1460 length:420 start_codon:yes stop_codon:yes gene_type:complete
MNERIKELLDKYWEASSSVEEEAELKLLLSRVQGFESEKQLFGLLDEMKQEEPVRVKIPKRVRVRSLAWLNWAASVAILLGSYVGWRVYERQQEEQAYREVVAALSLIQQNLSKGQEKMSKMNDLKYLSAPEDLFKTEE